MKPTDNNTLLHFIFDQMDKLDNKQIDLEQARVQAQLIKQANNTLRYELDRTSVQLEVSRHNKDGGRVIFPSAEKDIH